MLKVLSQTKSKYSGGFSLTSRLDTNNLVKHDNKLYSIDANNLCITALNKDYNIVNLVNISNEDNTWNNDIFLALNKLISNGDNNALYQKQLINYTKQFGATRIDNYISKSKYNVFFYAPIYVESIDDIPESFNISVYFKNDNIDEKLIEKNIIVNISKEKRCLLYKYIKNYITTTEENGLPFNAFLKYEYKNNTKYINTKLSYLSLKNGNILEENKLGYKTLNEMAYDNKHIIKQIIPISFLFNINDVLSKLELRQLNNVPVYVSANYVLNSIKFPLSNMFLNGLTYSNYTYDWKENIIKTYNETYQKSTNESIYMIVNRENVWSLYNDIDLLDMSANKNIYYVNYINDYSDLILDIVTIDNVKYINVPFSDTYDHYTTEVLSQYDKYYSSDLWKILNVNKTITDINNNYAYLNGIKYDINAILNYFDIDKSSISPLKYFTIDFELIHDDSKDVVNDINNDIEYVQEESYKIINTNDDIYYTSLKELLIDTYKKYGTRTVYVLSIEHNENIKFIDIVHNSNKLITLYKNDKIIVYKCIIDTIVEESIDITSNYYNTTYTTTTVAPTSNIINIFYTTQQLAINGNNTITLNDNIIESFKKNTGNIKFTDISKPYDISIINGDLSFSIKINDNVTILKRTKENTYAANVSINKNDINKIGKSLPNICIYHNNVNINEMILTNDSIFNYSRTKTSENESAIVISFINSPTMNKKYTANMKYKFNGITYTIQLNINVYTDVNKYNATYNQIIEYDYKISHNMLTFKILTSYSSLNTLFITNSEDENIEKVHIINYDNNISTIDYIENNIMMFLPFMRLSLIDIYDNMVSNLMIICPQKTNNNSVYLYSNYKPAFDEYVKEADSIIMFSEHIELIDKEHTYDTELDKLRDFNISTDKNIIYKLYRQYLNEHIKYENISYGTSNNYTKEKYIDYVVNELFLKKYNIKTEHLLVGDIINNHIFYRKYILDLK